MIDVWQTLRDIMALNEFHNFLDKTGGSFWGDLLGNSLGKVISSVIILIISTQTSRKIPKEESESYCVVNESCPPFTGVKALEPYNLWGIFFLIQNIVFFRITHKYFPILSQKSINLLY